MSTKITNCHEWNVPWKSRGEPHDEVEDAPAEDHGVVDVAQEAGEEHPVAQTLEGRHHATVQLAKRIITSWLIYQISCF